MGSCAVLVLASSCRLAPRRAAVEAPLGVAALGLDFPRAEQGALGFVVEIPRASARRVDAVTWELWLGGLPFASGVETTPRATSQHDGSLRVTVEAALVYRHLGWREGAAYVGVSLRGEVRLTGIGTGYAFAAHREVLVHGSPALDEAPE